VAGDADHGYRSLTVGVAGDEQPVHSGETFLSVVLCRLRPNVARSKPGELLTAANGRYLALMLLFAAISEVPYRYISTSGSFNVLVTLALGLVIAWGWQHRTLLSSAMALMAAALPTCWMIH
jgi:hypothetical protein